MSLLDGFKSLRKNINKATDEVVAEGIGDLVPELKVSMDDKELIRLAEQWKQRYATYEKDIIPKQKRNEMYWLGKQEDKNAVLQEDAPLTDNRLFSSFETFLPIATRKNPEPVVSSDETEEGQALADSVAKMLIYQADIQRLKLKLKRMVRYWGLYKLGVIKVGWDDLKDDIATVVLRPQKLILDPDATIDEDGYTGDYIGELREETAETLIDLFPSKKKYITDVVKGKLGTKVQFTEWRVKSKNVIYWTHDKEVLDKIKDPNWNYDKDEVHIDDFGEERVQTIRGRNHFASPQFPYIFLSIFNLGKHPHDDTSLFEQCIKLQQLIDRRMKQIDKNVGNMNGGAVVSGAHFTKEQAAQVSNTLAKGGTVYIPGGDVNTAYKRETGVPLPGDVFNNLLDARNELDNIFGTHSTTRGERIGTETARGRILLKASDESRIGGGITEFIEQVADQIFNWWVQLMMVYYDTEHVASVVGQEQSREFIRLAADEFTARLTVSVKEGSLIPKDDMTQRNEAIELWGAGALDPITLFSRLGFPNPRESAQKLLTWQQNPQGLFQEGQQLDNQPGDPSIPQRQPLERPDEPKSIIQESNELTGFL